MLFGQIRVLYAFLAALEFLAILGFLFYWCAKT